MNRTQTQLMEALAAEIRARWGPQVLQCLAEMASAADGIPTGFAALDRALGAGGIPRSRLTTWHGQPTSGMTTLAYALIAQAQTNQMVAVYVDVSHTFDPESAVCQGIDMRRLLLVRPASWGQALELLRDVVDVPVAGLLTLDTAIVGSGLPVQWHALARTLQRVGARLPQSPWTVLALLPQNIPETAAGSASVRLRVERKAWLHTDEVLRGYEVQITVLNNKLKPAAEPVILDLELRGQGT